MNFNAGPTLVEFYLKSDQFVAPLEPSISQKVIIVLLSVVDVQILS